MDTKIQDIARVCHLANKIYCEASMDFSQVDWDKAPQWQRDSIMQGVQFVLDNPDAPLSAQHDCWMKVKEKEGWVWGEVKDVDAKTHPCFLPYEQLPKEQQAKDAIFRAIVNSLKGI